jgi:hypothetical protein
MGRAGLVIRAREVPLGPAAPSNTSRRGCPASEQSCRTAGYATNPPGRLKFD